MHEYPQRTLSESPNLDPMMTLLTILPSLEGQIKTQVERVLREIDKSHHVAYEDDLNSPFATEVLGCPCATTSQLPSNSTLQW